jgi:hypothetical protein
MKTKYELDWSRNGIHWQTFFKTSINSEYRNRIFWSAVQLPFLHDIACSVNLYIHYILFIYSLRPGRFLELISVWGWGREGHSAAGRNGWMVGWLVGWLVSWLVGWLVGWLVYSCCSHFEHRASVKRFLSLQFLNFRHSVGLLGRVISPSQGCYLTQTDIHASSGIRTHDQRSSERRQFMPQTARPLSSALEGFGQLQNPMTSSEIEPATFRLVV